MGQVWLAENMATGGMVVLKALHRGHATSRDALALLRQEARAMARLKHRNIVRVFDLVEPSAAGDPLVIVMEWLEGETLAARLAAHRRLDVDDAIEIVLPLLSALAHAHAMGIIHCDLKPENVFLAREPDGTIVPKILDFGVAKSTAFHAEIIEQGRPLSGTPVYMSPEQARGEIDLDARSDVFAIGVVLYELVSGHNPFARDDVEAVLDAIIWDPPPPVPRVPAWLSKVIERAIAKHRNDRFSSAGELADALSRAARMTKRLPASVGAVRRRVICFGLAFASTVTVMLGGLTPTEQDTHAARADVTKQGPRVSPRRMDLH
jgi:serine/threonine-protein kinase